MKPLYIYLACVLILLGVAGCGGSSANNNTTSTSGSTTTTTPATPTATANMGAAKRIYVVQQPLNVSGAAMPNGLVLQFPASSSGSVSPAYTLSPGSKVAAVATDQVGDIYFVNGTNGNVMEYSTETTGTPAQIRQITASTASRICCVDGMAVSPSGAIVLGQDSGEVDEWSATANGAVAPSRYILGVSQTGGGASTVEVANHVAVDASDNLFVDTATPGLGPALAVFSSTATGNAAPARTLGTNGSSGALAVDATGNVYTAIPSCTGSGSSLTCTSAISIYGPGSTASSAPTRVIAGSATQLGTLGGITVDAVGNIYVVSIEASRTPSVLTFSATAVGNVAPTAKFTSPAWTTPDFNPSIAIY